MDRLDSTFGGVLAAQTGPAGADNAFLFHLSGSLVAGGACVLISAAMLYIVLSRQDWLFKHLLLVFTGLVFLVGISFLVDALIIGHEHALLVKTTTRVLVGATAVLAGLELVRLLPTIRSMPNRTSLMKANEELRRTENHLSEAIGLLDQRVEERTRELELLSVTDPLTNVHNRRGVMEKLEKEIERSLRYRHSLSLLMIDLDDFKKINDQFGHHAGDAVLVKAAERINQLSRSSDVVGRFGGEEFLMVLPNTTAEEARQLGERLCVVMESKPIRVDDHEITFTCSIGATQLTENSNLDALIQTADKALYEAKHQGKNRAIIGIRGYETGMKTG